VLVPGKKSESGLLNSDASKISEPRVHLNSPIREQNISPTLDNLHTYIKQYLPDLFYEYLITPKAKHGRGITEAKARTYISSLSQIPESINTPDDIIALDEPLKENPTKALRAFFDYLEIHHNQKTISGDDLERWRKIVKTPEVKAAGKVNAITNEEAEALYHAIDPKVRTFYKFVIFTGLRMEHAYKLLSDLYDDEIFKPKNHPEVAYIETERIAQSKQKQSALAVFPRAFIPELMIITNNIGSGLDFIEKALSSGGKAIQPHFMHLYTAREKAEAKETGKQLPPRMSGKVTRKFHAQILTDNGMDSVLVDYLQGRNISVGHSRYGEPIEPILEKYGEILTKPKRPFPDFSKPAPEGISFEQSTRITRSGSAKKKSPAATSTQAGRATV